MITEDEIIEILEKNSFNLGNFPVFNNNPNYQPAVAYGAFHKVAKSILDKIKEGEK